MLLDGPSVNTSMGAACDDAALVDNVEFASNPARERQLLLVQRDGQARKDIGGGPTLQYGFPNAVTASPRCAH